jgi:hypothetical protein
VMEVVSVTGIQDQLIQLSNSFDNGLGQINYSAIAPFGGTPPSGTFNIATITFHCLAESPASQISFNTSGGQRITTVAFGQGSVLGAAEGCAITQQYDAPLRLQPASVLAAKDSAFDLELWVNAAEGQASNGAAAYIDFNNTYLEAVSITADSTTFNEFSQSIDNAQGQLSYTGIAPMGGDAPTGSFKIATIRFNAKEEVAQTPITFSFAEGRKSAVTFDQGAIGGAHTNATVQILAGGFNGQVVLQGDERPVAGHNVPLTLKVYDSGTAITISNVATETPLYTFSTTDSTLIITDTDTTNHILTFSAPTMLPGSYNITVYTPHCLVNLKNNVTVTGSGTLVDMGELLAGDAQDISEGNTIINITDFGRFASSYEKASTDEGFDPTADFDESDFIDILDFTLLYTNFLKTSPQTVP